MNGRNPYCPPDEYRPTEAEEQCWKERHGHRFVGPDFDARKCPFYEYGDKTFEELARREAEIQKKTNCLEEFAKRLELESDKLDRIKRGLEKWRDALIGREKEVERKEQHLHYEEEVLKRLLNLDKLDMLKMLFRLDKLDELKTIDETLKTGLEEVGHIDGDIKEISKTVGSGFNNVIDYFNVEQEAEKKRRDFADSLSKRDIEKIAKLNMDSVSMGDVTKILSKTL